MKRNREKLVNQYEELLSKNVIKDAFFVSDLEFLLDVEKKADKCEAYIEALYLGYMVGRESNKR